MLFKLALLPLTAIGFCLIATPSSAAPVSTSDALQAYCQNVIDTHGIASYVADTRQATSTYKRQTSMLLAKQKLLNSRANGFLQLSENQIDYILSACIASDEVTAVEPPIKPKQKPVNKPVKKLAGKSISRSIGKSVERQVVINELENQLEALRRQLDALK